MNFFDVVKSRCTARKFEDTSVPEKVITQAVQDAVSAPNSSNIQLGEFIWVQSK